MKTGMRRDINLVVTRGTADSHYDNWWRPNGHHDNSLCSVYASSVNVYGNDNINRRDLNEKRAKYYYSGDYNWFQQRTPENNLNPYSDPDYTAGHE